VLKLSPHWNFKKDETAKIVIYTNCDEVTLYLNDKEIGKYNVEPLDDIRVDIPFEAGELRAVGIKDGKTYTDTIKTAGRTAALKCETVIPCERDGDIAIVEISARDKDGNLCPLANDLVEVSIKDGQIVGVCNGDPAYDKNEQPTSHAEHFNIRTFGTNSGKLYAIPPKATNTRRTRIDWIGREDCREGYCDDFRDVAKFVDCIDDPHSEVYTVTVNTAEDYEYIEFERFALDCDVYLNGKLIGSNRRSPRNPSVKYTRPYRFYAKFKRGENKIEVKTTLNGGVTHPFSGYVRLGRKVEEPMRVNLHYGLARVFLKTKNPSNLKAKIIK
jgi:hypothetical protein